MVTIMEENILRQRDTGIISYAIVCRHDFEEMNNFSDFIRDNNLELVSSRPVEKIYKGKLINKRLKYFDIESIYTRPELESVRNSIALQPSMIVQECIMNLGYFDYVVSIAIEIGKADIENGIRMLNNLGAGIRNYLDRRYEIIDNKFELAQRSMEQGLPVPDSSN